LENKYNAHPLHYSISIIKGRGIDRNAMDYLLQKHEAGKLQFLDGWVGKGSIYRELLKELEAYPEVDKTLAIVSDPSGLPTLWGTREDILIPSACLNAIVTGLISRTFLRKDLIGEKDFHGGAYYAKWEKQDLSKDFLDAIESEFDYNADLPGVNKSASDENETSDNSCLSEALLNVSQTEGWQIVQNIGKAYAVKDLEHIKPGIGETTRVLLRRMPRIILLNEQDPDAPELAHIKQLAKEKGVPMQTSSVSLGNYKACGIIRD
ncbi:MAG: hypothetical protein IJU50_05710, partial [Lachnospiraceae bacterium]|nr:hypothetical protein [Lachnospiraceae bacterium]